MSTSRSSSRFLSREPIAQALAVLMVATAAACSADAGNADDDTAARDESELGSSTLTFQNGVAPSAASAAYQGTTDTLLQESTPTTSNGAATTLRADGDYPDGTHKSVLDLVRWDLSSIPKGSTIASAKLGLSISNASTTGVYYVYAMKRAWNEAQATWTSPSSGLAWELPGARGASDRATASLGTITTTSTGAYTLALNAAGIAQVKSWVDHPETNFGVVIDNGANWDGLGFGSSEAPTPSDRVKLAVSFTAPAVADAGGNAPGDAGAGTSNDSGASDGGVSGGTQPTGPGIARYQDLSGATLSKKVNSTATSSYVSFAPGTFTFSDFLDGQTGTAAGASEYGVAVNGKGLLGSGPGQTILEMVTSTSTKSAAVPPNGNNQGGLANPTNNLYLVKLSAPGAKFDGITLQGTSQGHLYNGLRFESVSNPVLSNSKIASVPGNSGANPGETFAVNFNRASGTATISNVTIDGGSVGAAGIAANSCTAVLNVDGLSTSNLKYSAGIALWQQTGVVNLRHFVSQNNARALGAERLGAIVNIYDPQWGAPNIGHDITYTPYSGYTGGINFYFSSAATVPSRKIVILTNDAAVKPTVSVYVNNVKQTAANYITWQGI